MPLTTMQLETALKLLGHNLADGLQIYDVTKVASMHHPPINPDYPTILGPISTKQLATDLKKVLLNQYKSNVAVQWVDTHTGNNTTIPLDQIDRQPEPDETTLLFIPALDEMSSFEQFQEIIAHLRAPEPEGCPWDRKQTHSSLRRYLLEETYEVLDAIDKDDMEALAEELGDVLLQIVLHAQVAIDNNDFNMTDILRAINQKMVRRHPHVFSTTQVEGADEVVVNWQAIKQQEKVDNGKPHESLLDGVPKAMPALMLAYEYQSRAAKSGFDWPVIGDVRAKIIEELDEVLEAKTDAERMDEIGDVLFVMVNWARWLKIEPETALRETGAKFYRRFTFIEQRVRETGKPMTDFTLAELDAFWDEAKSRGL